MVPPPDRPATGEELTRVYPVLRYFEWGHLPEGPLREMSRSFARHAVHVARARPEGNPETATALRKLLESKDAAVRAAPPERD